LEKELEDEVLNICYKFEKKKFNIMQFILIAYDGEDPEALDRRLRVRPDHLNKIEILKESGEYIFGGAILDENGKMIGSTILYEFPDRKTMDERLKNEPYMTAGVWKKVTIHPFRLANIGRSNSQLTT
jgi:uncharacterized protein YciI